jgi:hypothetical protein
VKEKKNMGEGEGEELLNVFCCNIYCFFQALKRGLKKEHLVRLGIDEWYQDILWDAIEQWRKFA